jgi:hypothetical protein
MYGYQKVGHPLAQMSIKNFEICTPYIREGSAEQSQHLFLVLVLVLHLALQPWVSLGLLDNQCGLLGF